MRSAVIIILLYCVLQPLFGADYFFRIQSEYRRDAVDFEDETHEFYRQKAKICFSDKSEANAALVKQFQENSTTYTWNIFLRDVSANFSFFAGNFYANFGKGMLLGKRSPFQADGFSQNGEIFSGDSIIPASSGNPYFAFNGAGIMYLLSLSDFSIRSLAFYSLKERYISQDEYESKSTLSSVWSLENYDERTHCRIEPVYMHTAGANVSLALYRLFFIDAYGIRSEARSPLDEDIVLRDGVHHFNGFGCTAQYRDEFLSIFSEIASSRTTYKNNDGSEAATSGSASLSGIALRSAYFIASCAYKTAEAEYFSPYMATIGEYIGPGLFIDMRVMPLEKLIMGARTSSERKSAPSSTDKDIPSITKERLFCEYSSGWLHALRAEYARSYRSIDDTNRNRYRGTISFGNPSWVLLSTSGTYQTHNAFDASHCTTASLSLFFSRIISAHASWTRAHVASGNPLYEYLLPMKNTSIPGTFLRQSEDVYAVKFVFSRWGIYFSCRGIIELPDDGTRTTLFEAFASGQY